MEENRIDIKENYIYKLDNELLEILLKDRSSKKNIIWATDNYAHKGFGYQFSDEISIMAITGHKGGVVKPRTEKSKKNKQTVFVTKRKSSPLLGSVTNRIILWITHGSERILCSTKKKIKLGLPAPSRSCFPPQQARLGKIISTMFV